MADRREVGIGWGCKAHEDASQSPLRSDDSSFAPALSGYEEEHIRWQQRCGSGACVARAGLVIQNGLKGASFRESHLYARNLLGAEGISSSSRTLRWRSGGRSDKRLPEFSNPSKSTITRVLSSIEWQAMAKKHRNARPTTGTAVVVLERVR